MPEANQIPKTREDVKVNASDLIAIPEGTITQQGLELNIDVAIQYIESWLNGNGCVPIYNLMEDAATAEISRAQVWQWIRHGAIMESGITITQELVENLIPKQLAKIKELVGEGRYQKGQYEKASELFQQLVFATEFEEFLTLPAYRAI